MTWPSSDVTTTAMDSGSDTPPRAEIKSWADKFNQLRNHVTTFMQGLLDDADAAAARTTLDVPSRSGGNASGVWGISISGDASGTASNVTGIVARANGGLGANYASDAAIFAGIKQAASDTATGVVELATTAEAQTGTDTTRAVTPAAMQNGKIVQGTAVLVSGSTVDFTGIPSWAKRVNLMFWGVSGSGSTTWVIQLGTSSGFETTGYLSSTTSASSVASSINVTSGFAIVVTSIAASTVNGKITLDRLTGDTWVASGVLGQSDGAATSLVGGAKPLAAALDRVRFNNNGASWDAGTVNVSWE